MANTNNPSGFKPIRHMAGGEIRTNEYSIASAYATGIFYGDVVSFENLGKNISITAANAYDHIGVFQGVQYTDAQGKIHYSRYWPASTVASNIKAYVIDDPSVVYEVQCSTLANTNVGALANFIVGNGNTLNGNSTAYLDDSTYAALTKSVYILGLVNRPDNNYGAYAKVECVIINRAIYAPHT